VVSSWCRCGLGAWQELVECALPVAGHGDGGGEAGFADGRVYRRRVADVWEQFGVDLYADPVAKVAYP
jgi:hypothetical protein